MCGIFGIFTQNKSVTPDIKNLEASAKLLDHRGPDAKGTYHAAGIGLAHTRLSLVDLNPRSNQPFWDISKRYCLVFNGEIYNFKELRSELEKQHHIQFLTSSDTEVLLYGLIHYGTSDFLNRLQGMFAFALYDSVEETVILGRDRFGMKPLYIYEDDASIIFTSEIKALRPWQSLELDQFSISSYLSGFGGPTKGFTFYRKVKSVAPGSVVTLRRSKPAQYDTYFEMTDFWDEDAISSLNQLKPVQMVDRMDELLYNSVEKHMFADSPVGAFCSGGVDS